MPESSESRYSSAALHGLLWSLVFSTLAHVWTLWLCFRALGVDLGTPSCNSQGMAAVAIYFAIALGMTLVVPAWIDRPWNNRILMAARMTDVVLMTMASMALYGRWIPLIWISVCGLSITMALTCVARQQVISDHFGLRYLVFVTGIGNGLVSLSGMVILFFVLPIYSSLLTSATQIEFWQYALPLFGFSMLAALATMAIPPPPLDEEPLSEPIAAGGIWQTLPIVRRYCRPLIPVACGLAFFWALAAMTILQIPEFAGESLSLSITSWRSILAFTILGWGAGCVVCGLISHRVELGLVPWGAFGIAVAGVMLSWESAGVAASDGGRELAPILTFAVLGFAGGIFQTPLQAQLQYKLLVEHRTGFWLGCHGFVAATILLALGVWTAGNHWTRPRGFTELPASYQLSSATPQSVRLFDEAARELSGKSTSGSDANPESSQASLEHLGLVIESVLLSSAPSSAAQQPTALVAELLRRDMEIRQRHSRLPALQDYRGLFPDRPELQAVAEDVYFYATPTARISAGSSFLMIGLMMFLIVFYAAWRLPQAMARLPLWWAFCLLYRVRINGLDRLPAEGGGVLVVNHQTWIDGLIILLMSTRRIRMIAWAGNFGNPVMRFLAWFAGVILITGGPKSIQRGLAEARKALNRGELVGIFPEGGLSRTGQLQSFRPGLLKILDQLPVPIIPVYIDQIWGSIFSFAGGKSIWKFPNSLRHRITINIGRSITRPESIHFVRQAVAELSAESVVGRQPPFIAPAARMIRQCKRRRFSTKINDSTHQKYSGGMLLARAAILRRLLGRAVLDSKEKNVGVLIPPSSGAVITNMALALDRRIAINLNYTLTEKQVNECIRIAKVRTVLTSRKVMEKFGFQLDCKTVFLEDLKEHLRFYDTWVGAAVGFAVPAWLLIWLYDLNRIQPDDEMTVIFTSGSTGVPKGVVLSAQNIGSNVEAISQVINLNSKDVLIGCLPFFHSFGFTVTLWSVLGLSVRGAYHFNPLEAAQIGKLTRANHGTVLLGTPTFLRAYLRKCTREDFQTLDTVMAGAEKLPRELSIAFENRFGVRPVEGYGATETSPITAVNIPPSRTIKNFQVDNKEGTVGRTIPNVAAKITDLDDERVELGAGQSGMLWIKGPNIMLGYLDRPELTKEAIVDGWYRTGDVAQMDEDGFITLTGRLSRFSKIGGEMVPHIQVEEALNSMYQDRDCEKIRLAVTSVPDPKKGERLVVLYTELESEPDELRRRLREMGLPNLFIPSSDSFYKVDNIPILGTGKYDLKKISELAQSLASS